MSDDIYEEYEKARELLIENVSLKASNAKLLVALERVEETLEGQSSDAAIMTARLIATETVREAKDGS